MPKTKQVILDLVVCSVIINHTRHITLLKGDTNRSINCNYTSSTKLVKFSWRKPGLKPDVFEYVSNGKIKMNEKFAKNVYAPKNCILTASMGIREVTNDFKGVWICELLVPSGEGVTATLDRVTVDVISPPQVDGISELKRTPFRQGETLYMKCDAVGDGKLRYRWYRNQVLHSKWSYESSIVVHNLSEEDHASWYCEVNNNAGNATSPKVQVNVNHSPITTGSKTHIKKSLNERATLFCHFSAFPAVKILEWRKGDCKNKESYISPKEYDVINNLNKGISTLNLDLTSEEDFACYRCFAENEEGHAESPTIEIIRKNEGVPQTPVIAEQDKLNSLPSPTPFPSLIFSIILLPHLHW